MSVGLVIEKIADISSELSSAGSFDDLCRLAVSRGREVLGVDRLGLWFSTDVPLVMRGSFGINESGHLRDEREARVTCTPESLMGRVMLATGETVLSEEESLLDHCACPVGGGVHLVAGLWDGTRQIGCLSVDNLFSQDRIDEETSHLLRLYATLLAPFCARERIRQDVKDLRRELEMLQSLVDESNVMVFLWRLQEGFPVDYASHSVRVLGYSPEDFTSGRVQWVAITHPDDVPRLEAEIEHYIAERRAHWTQQYRVRDASGAYRWIEDRNRLILDHHGEPTHIQGVLLDVTERYEFEEKLHSERDRASQQVGRALHDSLGQELTGISCLAKSLSRTLAKRGYAESDQAEKLAMLAARAVEQTRRISHGLTPVDLSAEGLADSLHALVDTMAELYGVAGSFKHDGSVSIETRTEALHLYHIAQEALHNAVRHGAPTRIDVRLCRDGDATVLEIRDDGCGFEEGVCRGRHGLGLMAYRTTLIGGTFGVHSVPGEGTTVTVRN